MKRYSLGDDFGEPCMVPDPRGDYADLHEAMQAILTAIAAEKATWPHAGVMHAAARTACDNIATRIKQMMGDA